MMNTIGHFTQQEILSQPEAWAAGLDVIQQRATALRNFYRQGKFEKVVFTGCGSTYYLSLASAALMQEQMGIPAKALPASEIWLYPRSSYLPDRRTLLIAVSRSGATTETLRGVEAFRGRANGSVMTLSCYPDAPLTGMGDLNIVLPSGQEDSIAQTRAFSTLYLATAALTALWNEEDYLLDELGRLPEVGRGLLGQYQSLAEERGQQVSLERFYFLGSGPRYGLACELSLKMKEMTLSHSEPFHFMEFRHGPQSMLTADTLMIGLVSESNHSAESKVLEDMRSRGANILAMGESEGDVIFNSGVSEAARNVLYLPIGQLMAFHRSIGRGLDPDRPHNLDAVVRLDG